MKKKLSGILFIFCFPVVQSVFAGTEIPGLLTEYPEVHSEIPDTFNGYFQPSQTFSRSRTWIVAGTTLGLYPLSMAWLYTQWYRDYPQTTFHFFNDNNEWEQMDKVGHMWDAYNIAKPLGKSFRWSGHDGKKSALYGAGIAFLYQTTIEVLDAFSAEWGFSTGDLICNTSGVGLYLFQELGWKEQRMVLKYSFHRTQYADYRPDLLGKSLPENILKDYNGLTYWLCINPRSFLSNSSTFPAWLSIGLGYGAQGMTGGISNPSVVNGKPIPDFERYRQFYLSLDLDLSRVHFKSRFLTSVARVINIIHLPAPTVEFSRGRKTVFHPLYF